MGCGLAVLGLLMLLVLTAVADSAFDVYYILPPFGTCVAKGEVMLRDVTQQSCPSVSEIEGDLLSIRKTREILIYLS